MSLTSQCCLAVFVAASLIPKHMLYLTALHIAYCDTGGPAGPDIRNFCMFESPHMLMSTHSATSGTTLISWRTFVYSRLCMRCEQFLP